MQIKSFKQFLLEGNTEWKLDPSLKSDDFVCDGNFTNTKKWQAKIFTKESDKIGQMDNVGYVMFNMKTHTFIPIAREDEHHRGYDHIEDNLKKNTNDWYPIYLNPSNTGNYHDYIYQGREQKALEILKSLGENGLNLKNFKVQSMGGKTVITAEQFVESGGKLEYVAGKLSEEGTTLVKKLRDLANQANTIRNDPMLDKKIKGFKNNTLSLLHWFEKLYPNELLYVSSFHRDVDSYIKRIEGYPEDSNLLKMIELDMFGFKGFKNKIHLMLKNTKEKENTDSFFGDSAMAKGIFDGL